MDSNRKYGVDWTDRPDAEEMQQLWQILRAPKKGEHDLLIISHNFTGARTHFWNGRTRPCTGANCTPCAQQNNNRWHGYLAAWSNRTKSRVILELTATPAKTLIDYFKEHRTMRGAIIRLGRTSEKANARVRVQITGTYSDPAKLEIAPDIRKIMARVWELRDDG